MSPTEESTPAAAYPSGSTPQKRPAWLLLAIASGACAAFNGVFAKLTTTELTTTWATGLSHFLGFKEESKFIEYGVRAFFFGCNLVFNAIMWALFTRALTLGDSTTRVSIINTSANFMLTAMLGLFIFAEVLPPLWWGGAALLVAGSVVIGMREQQETSKESNTGVAQSVVEGGPAEERFRDEPDNREDREDSRSEHELRDLSDNSSGSEDGTR